MLYIPDILSITDSPDIPDINGIHDTLDIPDTLYIPNISCISIYK